MNSSSISRSSSTMSSSYTNDSNGYTPVTGNDKKKSMNDLILSMNSMTAATTVKMAELNVGQAKANTEAAKKLSDVNVKKTYEETAKQIKQQKRHKIWGFFKKIFRAITTVASVFSGVGLAVKAVKTVAKIGVKSACKLLGKNVMKRVKHAAQNIKGMFGHLRQEVKSIRNGELPAKLMAKSLSSIQTNVTNFKAGVKNVRNMRPRAPNIRNILRNQTSLITSNVEVKALSKIDKAAIRNARVAKMGRSAAALSVYSEGANKFGTAVNQIQSANVDAKIAAIKLTQGMLKSNIEYLNHEKESRIADLKDTNELKVQSARIVSDMISKTASLSNKMAQTV